MYDDWLKSYVQVVTVSTPIWIFSLNNKFYTQHFIILLYYGAGQKIKSVYYYYLFCLALTQPSKNRLSCNFHSISSYFFLLFLLFWWWFYFISFLNIYSTICMFKCLFRLYKAWIYPLVAHFCLFTPIFFIIIIISVFIVDFKFTFAYLRVSCLVAVWWWCATNYLADGAKIRVSR